jgi:hypothetical protein
LAVIAGIWLMRRRAAHDPPAYIADRSVTLWSSAAQVRRPLATLAYGEKVMVLRHSGDQVEVQAEDGAQGWVDTRLLMDSALWQRAAELLAHAREMPAQALGHTRTISNVHIHPGREAPRIFQFGRNVPVVVLERRVMDVTPSGAAEGPREAESVTPGEKKPDGGDWLLVLRADTEKPESAAASRPSTEPKVTKDAEPAIPVAGWVLSRFVELDPPPPIGDYTSSVGGRVVAWALLNTGPDANGNKPQYLVAGIRGGEGQPCDFTWIRVFTWGAQRRRYETAYVESQLCGHLPIRVRQTRAGPEFRFPDQTNAERTYQMTQTIVRRVGRLEGSRRKAK